MNLDISKKAYYYGSLVNYIICAFVVSLINTVFCFFIDILYPSNIQIANLMNVTGWSNNGIIISFLQQFAFLLLLAIVIHVVVSLQRFWYGWALDVIIIAVISVFVPIEPLRNIIAGFFKLIMFNSNYLLQIFNCFILALLIYALELIPLKKRTV